MGPEVWLPIYLLNDVIVVSNPRCSTEAPVEPPSNKLNPFGKGENALS
jgi:hypothetical protein